MKIIMMYLAKLRPRYAASHAMLLVGSLGLATLASAQPKKASSPVAATVNDQVVTWRAVQRQVDRTLRGRKATPEALAQLRLAARDRLISRELILLYLAEHDAAPSPQDVDVEISRIEKRLALEETSLPKYLSAAGMTLPEFRDLLRWQLGWQWYLDRYLTDANLERHFKTHRRHFDGTRLRVAQILFKTDQSDADTIARAKSAAEQVRTAIQAGEYTFAEAAKRHSAAPSGAKGGDIGWIERHRPMQESFSKTAFNLKEGQVSEPVVTAVGVHLIQCLEVEPGQRDWTAVREPLQIAVTAYLFDWVAGQQRGKAKIQRMAMPGTADADSKKQGEGQGE